MKKMFFAVSALAALSLLAPSVGFAAQGTAANQIGIYSDATGDVDSANIDIAPSNVFHAYLVLTNPINNTRDGGTNTNTPVTMVEGFEVRVIKPAGLNATWFQMGEALPPDGIDAGTAPDYVVGFGTPFAVVGNATVLIDWTLMMLSGDPHEWYLGLTSFPSLDGTMSYQDADDTTVPHDQGNIPLVSAYPSSGDYADAVFSVNGTAVAIENESWGNVKALFR